MLRVFSFVYADQMDKCVSISINIIHDTISLLKLYFINMNMDNILNKLPNDADIYLIE